MDLIEGWPEDGKMITDGLAEGRVMTQIVWEAKWGSARRGLGLGGGNSKISY